MSRCLGRGAHVAYSANAAGATEEALKTLLGRIYKLNEH